MSEAPLTYKSAGVDLEKYETAMAKLPALMQRTHVARVIDNPGGFAGLFRLQGKGRKYHDPVLVSGTDGVGTKLKVAADVGKFDTVGIDLVAMSVNDCLCMGAEPLFFLDYVALPKDDPEMIAALVSGVSAGCVEAGCALLGGETAILPGIYAEKDYDLAGFCTAVVERKLIVDGRKIKPGDFAIGLASSGFHSNGYSLIRKAVFDVAKLTVDARVPELDATVGEILLTPTRIYVQPVLEALWFGKTKSPLKGLAHVTGGGIADNLVRIFPEGCRLIIDRKAWPTPPEFQWLQGLAKIDREEMFRVFNMGIGFVVIVRPKSVERIRNHFTNVGIENWILGEVTAGERTVDYVN